MMSPRNKFVAEAALFIVTNVIFFYGLKYVFKQLDPTSGSKKAAKDKAQRALEKLGRKDLELTDHEHIIATELIHPDDIKVTFEDIGGLEMIVEDLKETVIYPLRYPDVFNGSNDLLGPPKGVLLYGPPGCGKTMLAKCLAKESGATFLNMRVSTMTDKWFGESNKLVAALFSLAKKMQPCIIFVDEIDCFLRERSSSDHEVNATIKAEFMTLWDGLVSGPDTQILILGATNRPLEIDQAILRRMPKRFNIAPPKEDQRIKILNLFLAKVESKVNLDINKIAAITAGMTGSDLKELCREAAMLPVREFMKEIDMAGHHRSNMNAGADGSDMSKVELKPRVLETRDFIKILKIQGYSIDDFTPPEHDSLSPSSLGRVGEDANVLLTDDLD